METDDGLNGFLPSQPLPFEVHIDRSHGAVTELAKRINRECHRLIFGVKISKDDLRGQFLAALFLRALQHYQASVLLLSKGLVASGRVSTRATLESVFAIGTVARSDEMARVRQGR